jgi:hypothetical protein
LNDVEKVPLLQTKAHEYHDKPKKKQTGCHTWNHSSISRSI